MKNKNIIMEQCTMAWYAMLCNNIIIFESRMCITGAKA